MFELANPSYLDLIGDRDVVGKPVREALPGAGGPGRSSSCSISVYATGEPHVGKARPADGPAPRPASPPEECFFDFVYQPMRDATGEVDGIAVVAFEVTELARARREAEVANRTKDEFLAMLGHELRNPLAPILTALQLMRLRGGATLEQERTVIERQARHLVRLVDDLLDVSRIARGKIELRRERVDAGRRRRQGDRDGEPAARGAAARARASTCRADLRGRRRSGAPGAGRREPADQRRQVHRDRAGSVQVAAERDGDEIVIRVRDSGIGIAPEMLPHVFDMFAQERQALDRTQGGLGLGLTIVRSLAELHGGTVEAASDGRGQGSEFVVRLPAAAAARRAAATTGAGTRADRASRRHAAGVAVLVVDDNEDAAEMLAGVRAAASATACGSRSTARRRCSVAREMSPRHRAARHRAAGDGRLRAGAAACASCPGTARLKLVAITGYGQEADRERSRAGRLRRAPGQAGRHGRARALLRSMRRAGDAR